LDKTQKTELMKFALRIRIESMKEFKQRGFGHIGGALSVVDALAVLYGVELRIDPKNPGWPGRDWVVMSKGHAGPALYATLALKGYFPLEWLGTLNTPGTRLPSHCDRNLTPGIDATTGSLGQGASQAVGVALSFKLDERPNYTYLFIGDGECDEGQIWEAAAFAAFHKLDNLIMFVDVNGKQLDGATAEVLDMGDLAVKFGAFGWHAQTVAGNDVEAISGAIAAAKAAKGAPSAIVMRSVKGSGVPAIEAIELNHHINISAEAADQSIELLEKQLAGLEQCRGEEI